MNKTENIPKVIGMLKESRDFLTEVLRIKPYNPSILAQLRVVENRINLLEKEVSK